MSTRMLHSNLNDPAQLRNNRCEVEYDLTPYGLGGAAIHPLDNGRICADLHYLPLTQCVRASPAIAAAGCCLFRRNRANSC